MVHVLYGSQTGNAKEIARRIFAGLSEHGLAAGEFGTAGSLEKLVEDGEPAVVIVVAATTGDGDPTDDARPLVRYLRKCQGGGALAKVRYAILGLGDTNYENFCGGAKRLEKALRGTGAVSFYNTGYADDGVGLELIVEPWIEGLWPALVKEVGPLLSSSPPKPVQQLIEHEGLPSLLPRTIRVEKIDTIGGEHSPRILPGRSEGVIGVVVNARRLTSPDSTDRRVWHIEVDLGSQQVSYTPGDAFGISVENEESDVEAILTRVNDVAEDELVLVRKLEDSTVWFRCSVRDAIRYHCDIFTPPKKTLLRALAGHCEIPAERDRLLRLSSKSGKDEYRALFMSPVRCTFVDLLHSFTSCRPPFELLIDQLTPLLHRHYSAASCMDVDGTVVHFAFSVVKHKTRSGEERLGVATGMLEKICEAFIMDPSKEQFLHVTLPGEGTGSFAPPPDLASSYIMIGPGTGIAPFRGFLRQRRYELSMRQGRLDEGVGSCFLFFGCRRSDVDYLYGEELEVMYEQEVLTHFSVAFSRQYEDKVYVQHKMDEQSAEIYSLLTGTTTSRVYVCGDGRTMADDVQRKLVHILMRHGSMSEEEAVSFLKGLSTSGRYRREIWYWG